MKRILVASMILLFLAGTVSADVGIGLKWFTESEYVNEGDLKCLIYDIYNPFDTDVTGFLEATNDLEKIYQAEEPKLITAHTSSKKAIPTKICFNIPKVYREESFFGILPRRQCNEEEVTMKGEIVAAYKLTGATGTGSVTGASFAAPLRLRIRCTPMDSNWTFGYAFIGLLIINIILLAHLKKKRSS